MKGKLFYLFLLGGINLFLVGCSSVTQTIYLQNVDVSGPLNQPPIEVMSQPGSTFTVSPKLSLNGRQYLSGNVESHSTVNENNVYQIDTIFNSDGTKSYKISGSNVYDYKGDNMKWNIPQFAAGLDMDIKLSNSFAFTGGLSYSGDSNRDYFGGTLGIGIFELKENRAFRFDAGIIWQNLYYDAASIVVTKEYNSSSGYTVKDVSFFRDKGNLNTVNPYLSFTYNSAVQNSPINFFVSLGFFTQTVVSFDPNNYDPDYSFWGHSLTVKDKRGESMATFLTLTPGLILNFGMNGEIVVGAKILHENSIGNTKQSTFLSPTVQFNFHL